MHTHESWYKYTYLNHNPLIVIINIWRLSPSSNKYHLQQSIKWANRKLYWGHETKQSNAHQTLNCSGIYGEIGKETLAIRELTDQVETELRKQVVW